jgi:hypothetical protein
MTPKQLIIDKSVFHGSSTECLAEFCRNHQVVLPHALYAECLMSRNRPDLLLQRFIECVKCGAAVGWGSPNIVQRERQSLQPVAGIINKDDTMGVRKGDLCDLCTDQKLLKSEANKWREHYEPQINWLCDIAKKYLENIEKKGLLVKFREEVSGTSLLLKDRLAKWVKNLDVLRSEILKDSVPELAKDLHSDWVTWHLLRLSQAWGIELSCRSTTSNLSTVLRDISNDYWDIQYVVSLSRTDGILTKDKNLIIPLAQAAFPEKDVFSDIDEVLYEYLCH